MEDVQGPRLALAAGAAVPGPRIFASGASLNSRALTIGTFMVGHAAIWLGRASKLRTISTRCDVDWIELEFISKTIPFKNAQIKASVWDQILGIC